MTMMTMMTMTRTDPRLAWPTRFLDVGVHRADRLRVVITFEDRRSCDEGVRARPRDRANVVHLHAPIDLEPHCPAGRIDAPPGLGQLLQGGGNELLTPEPRIHGHDQHHVQLLQGVVEIVERRRRIEYQARLATVLAYELNGPIDVIGRLGME